MPTLPPGFPVAFTGPGDKVVDVSTWGPGVVMIVAAQTEDSLSVESLNENGDPVDLLVDTFTSAYTGMRPINWPDQEKAHRIEVDVNDLANEWSISFLPMDSEHIHTINQPGTYSNTTDDVLRISGFTGNTAAVNHAGEANIIVEAYDSQLELLEIPVNEIGPYTETVTLPAGTIYLVVLAQGQWSMDIAGQ
jgi:hypothetical protein